MVFSCQNLNACPQQNDIFGRRPTPQQNLPRTTLRCFRRVPGSFFGSRILTADFLTSPCAFLPNMAAWKSRIPQSIEIFLIKITSFICSHRQHKLNSKWRKISSAQTQKEVLGINQSMTAK